MHKSLINIFKMTLEAWKKLNHKQIWFLPAMEGWFVIQKSINVTQEEESQKHHVE